MAGVTLEEFEQYSAELSDIAVDSVTRFGEILADNAALSQEQFAEALAQERYNALQEMQTKTQVWADRAAAAGDAAKADVFQRIADTYADVAGQYSTTSAAEFTALMDAKIIDGLGKVTGLAGDVYDANQAWQKYQAGDLDGTSATLLGMLAGVAVWSLALPAGIPIALVAAIAAGWGFEEIFPGWDSIFDYWGDVVDDVNDFFTDARNWIRRDPLVLDLDGDGIETIGASDASVVLFDHDGDGNKSGTGWVRPDDGLLVLDRNGNGSIDNGAELFGVDTVLADGSKATDGFSALRDLDANGDGVFDANDAQFANVQVWRDLDQDGVSDAGELMSLADTGIASINLDPTVRVRNYGNGNQQTAESTYTRTDGTTRTIANLDLQDNPFYRTFADPIPLTPAAQALPEMGGAGAVRDLREAASLSGDLATAVANYANLTTRDAQLSQLDGILHAWADTSGMPTSIELAQSQGYILIYLVSGYSSASYDPYLENWYNDNTGSGGSIIMDPDQYAELEALRQQQAALTRMIGTLERFNGVTFVEVEPEGVTTGAGQSISASSSTSSGGGGAIVYGPPRVYVSLSTTQISMLSQSFEALKESVYGGLVMQTRLSAYTDAIEISLDANGLNMDFTGVESLLTTRRQSDSANALIDLIELNRFGGQALYGLGWAGLDMLRTWVEQAAGDVQLQSVLTEMGVSIGSGTMSGTDDSDTLFGQSGADSLYGDDGNDQLSGGAGNDRLYGQAGSDTLDGGAGNDTLDGGFGNDVYLFGRGSGQDTLSSYDAEAGKRDAILLAADVLSTDVTLSRSGNSLVLTINGTTDRLTVNNYFYNDANDGNGYYRVEEIRFVEGTVWDIATVKSMILVGNDTAQTITGYATADVINAGADNDTLNGNDGNDSLNGEAGNDTLNGGNGNDTLDGGAGNDTLYGNAGSDVYLFGRGAGQDMVYNTDSSTGKTDAIQFAADVLPGDITISRSGLNLVLSINGTTDQLTVYRYFDADGTSTYKLEEIRFANGTVWNVATVKSMALVGNETNQTLTGYATADYINGAGGNDTISGAGGSDFLFGGAGNDSVSGNDGNDIVQGAAGADNLYGGNGDDYLNGGADNDTLWGDAGSDVYLFGRGAGQDLIYNTDSSTGKVDAVQFAADVLPGDITISRSGLNLVLSINGTTDQLTVYRYFDADGTSTYKLEEIYFNDGTVWTIDQVKALALVGTEANQSLTGYATADVINGAGGNDTLSGAAGNDTLDGGAGTDSVSGNDGDDVLLGGDGTDNLYGGNGNDTLDGGAGNDRLYGDRGSDLYQFARGAGQDTVNDYNAQDANPTTYGSTTDVLQLASDIAHDQLWFSRSSNSLQIQVIGTNDRITVENWYLGETYQIEELHAGDGYNLLNEQVEQLVQAMAAFAPPASGELNLPESYRTDLDPVLAANWQAA